MFDETTQTFRNPTPAEMRQERGTDRYVLAKAAVATSYMAEGLGQEIVETMGNIAIVVVGGFFDADYLRDRLASGLAAMSRTVHFDLESSRTEANKINDLYT